MYNFFNRNRFFQSLLLFPLFGGIIYFLLVYPVTFDFEWSPFIPLFFPANPTAQLPLKILAITILFATLILGRLFFRKYGFFDTPSYYAPVFYISILLLSGIYEKSFSPLFFIFILVIILFINTDYNLPDIKGKIFISGILVGIISFANVTAVLLLFFLIGSLMVHRFAKMKDICVAFFGLLLPIIYFLSYYFLTDQLGRVMEAYSHLSFFGFTKSLVTLSAFQLIKLILLILILFYFMIWLRLQYASKLIVLRRCLVSIDIMTIVLLAMLFFSNSSYMEMQLYMAVPLTTYFSLVTREQRKWIFHNVLIITTFLLLWL